MPTNQPGPIAQQLQKIQSNGQSSAILPRPTISQTPAKKSSWTGFAGKTLWDWLKLMAQLLIPIVIAMGSIWFSIQQNATSLELSKQQHDSDQNIATANRQKDLQIADDQQQATTLNTYFNDMTDLMLNHGLRQSKPDDEVKVVAKVKTLTALRRLNGVQKGSLIQFLYEAKLINSPQDSVIINLSGADLRGAALEGANLAGAFLDNVDLSGADLKGADLRKVILTQANLSHADLSAESLTKVDPSGGGEYTPTNLYDAELNDANLRGANLSWARLSQTDLRGANLSGANLSRAALGVDDAKGANLLWAIVTLEQLAQTSYLKNTTLPDGSTYPSRSYPIPNHREPIQVGQ